MREGQTEVLVVGAGPVGLWTALVLARAGVQVTVIDGESRTAARSYACALHPGTLKRLDAFELLPALHEHGRRIPTISFYDRKECRARLDLARISAEFPYLLIIPQNAFETVLEQALRKLGISVHWNHRFDGLTQEDEAITAMVEELEGTSTGYIVPHWETVVKRRVPVRTQFLIGADGHNSMVRQRLGIDWERAGQRGVFVAFEFETDSPGEEEVRVVLDETTNVLWPLPNNRRRWTFQLVHSEGPEELPDKDRRAIRLDEPNFDERVRQYIQRVCAHRAPWFRSEVRKVDWSSEVVFERRVATRFGRGRCWLAGDAAHQTGPVGVQSMNMGFMEGERLGGGMLRILQEKAQLSSLEQYGVEQDRSWRNLLGLGGGLEAKGADVWVREHRSQLLSCLPGVGEDLVALSRQLGLNFAP
jgi:6-methylpretetramide 4-monooxygenase / 4-hydroxy-6-methylpretetramide 12a-monooxygenase